MHLRRIPRSGLALRQNTPTPTIHGYLMPTSYCAPTCPNCHEDTAQFSIETSCVKNSSFITNCGACSQCIITYAIEQQSTESLEGLEGLMSSVLNLCLNTTVSSDILALESQVSRLSDVVNYMTSSGSSSFSTSHSITPTPTSTISHASGTSSITPVAVISSPTSSATFTTPPAQIQSTPASQSPSQNWIVGPVIGSILGMATVFIVIYLTRRKQRRDANREAEIKEVEDDDSGDSTQGKPQLHSESVAPRELDTNEVYEMEAREPVGSELTTPKDGVAEDWPLPITPLRAMFAMAEIQDQRKGNNESPKHDTYYHGNHDL